MKINRIYKSKENGRLYQCFYKNEYADNEYSIAPLEPTELESRIYPFPHLRIDYIANNWELQEREVENEK